MVKNPPAVQETQVQSLGWEIPWRKERLPTPVFLGFPGGASGKEPTCQCRRHKRFRFNPWVGNGRRAWQPTPVFMPGESLGQRSLVGYGPLGHKVLDTTDSTYHALKR